MLRLIALGIRNHSQFLKTSSVLVLFSIRIPLSFVFSYLLSHALGAGGIGTYFLATAIISFFGIFATFGLPDAIVRYTATYSVKKDRSSLIGLYRQARTIGLIASGCVVTLLYLTIPLIANHIFNEPQLTTPLYLLSLIIFINVQTGIHSAALRGLKRVVKSIFIPSAFIPISNIVIILFLYTSMTVTRMVLVNLLTSLIGLTIVFIWWHNQIKNIQVETLTFHTRKLLNSTFPLLLIALIDFTIDMGDTLILGMISDEVSVGIYGIARRNARIIGIIIIAFNQLVAPRFAELYAKGEFEELGQLARQTTTIMILLALPILVGLSVFAEPIMGLFGQSFGRGSSTMIILAVGQFIQVVSGSVGSLLTMTGRERLLRNSIIMASAVNIALNWILIPDYDILGAAIATLASVIVLNLMASIYVYRELRLIVIPIFPRFVK